jgi:hypothetical protein
MRHGAEHGHLRGSVRGGHSCRDHRGASWHRWVRADASGCPLHLRFSTCSGRGHNHHGRCLHRWLRCLETHQDGQCGQGDFLLGGSIRGGGRHLGLHSLRLPHPLRKHHRLDSGARLHLGSPSHALRGPLRKTAPSGPRGASSWEEEQQGPIGGLHRFSHRDHRTRGRIRP